MTLQSDEEMQPFFVDDGAEDDDRNVVVPGQDMARLFLPSTRTFFESMEEQGRDWKTVLSLAKQTEIRFSSYRGTYYPVSFCEEFDRLMDQQPGCGLNGGVLNKGRYIWSEGMQHVAAKWLRHEWALIDLRYGNKFFEDDPEMRAGKL